MKPRNIFNEDLESESSNNDKEEDLVVKIIESNTSFNFAWIQIKHVYFFTKSWFSLLINLFFGRNIGENRQKNRKNNG